MVSRWKVMSPDLREHPNYRYIDVVRASDYDALAQRIEHLEAALRGLHDDNVDYLRLNNLGGYDNHWLKRARDVLGAPYHDCVDGPYCAHGLASTSDRPGVE